VAKINRNIFQKNVQNAALFVLSDILIIISMILHTMHLCYIKVYA